MTVHVDLGKSAGRAAGYRDATMRSDYQYADVLASAEGVSHTADLVLFSQLPPSYRTAAIAFVRQGDATAQQTAFAHRSLGAPLVVVMSDEVATIWSIHSERLPTLVDEITPTQIPKVFAAKADVWSPQAVLRAKSVGGLIPNDAPDFIDLGLLPAIGEQVRIKLAVLIEKVVAAAGLSENLAGAAGRALLRDCFRLLAAKILLDRGHADGEQWSTRGVRQVLGDIDTRYGLGSGYHFDETTPTASLEAAWSVLQAGLNVGNVSATDLAYVYENALVTPQIRKALSTHSTPAHVADYIAERLELWKWGSKPPRVFEPFAGASVLLVAALKYMRDALPDLDEEERHDVLVNAISGAEVDDFATEVAKLSLILADYPNANGWRIESVDLFKRGELTKRLDAADIVLCNPPYEDFTIEERSLYGLPDPSKARWILNTVLDSAPDAIGFVMPQTLINGDAYQKTRARISELYDDVELVALPDKVFHVSGLETSLLIAKSRRSDDSDTIHLQSAEVHDSDRKRFQVTGVPSVHRRKDISRPLKDPAALWVPPLYKIWEFLSGYPRLGSFADLHRGIEWKSGRQEHGSGAAAGAYTVPGLHRLKGYHQYSGGKTVHLNIHPDDLRGTGQSLDWVRPKVVLNAIRKSRGPWRLAASVDRTGLVLSQQYIGVWPKAPHVNLDVLAAILNSPVASAFCFAFNPNKGLVIGKLSELPMPPVWPDTLEPLVEEYMYLVTGRPADALLPAGLTDQLARLLNDIDSMIIAAYDMPAALESELLDTFVGQPRPVDHHYQFFGQSTASPRARMLHANLALRSRFAKENGRLDVDALAHDIEGPLGVEVGGGAWYPPFQFDASGQVLASVVDAVRILEGQGLAPWQIALWFSSGNGWLGDKSPMESVDDPDALRMAARRALGTVY